MKGPTTNSIYLKVAVQGLNESSCFLLSSGLLVNLALRKTEHIVDANR